MNRPLSLLTAILCFAASAKSASEAFTLVNNNGSQVSWATSGSWASIKITITGKDIYPVERAFRPGEAIAVPLSGFPDGNYQWSASGAPIVDPVLATNIKKAREAGNETLAQQLVAAAPVGGSSSGSFSVSGGIALSTESPADGSDSDPMPDGMFGTLDIVNAEDTIIQGSLAVGIDSVNNESFGFDTVRLKENNTRIAFVDTSSSAGFTNNDWTIVANDSASGGANYLGFRDNGPDGGTGAESGVLSFRIEAGAGEGALWVDSNSRVGLGTTTPLLHLHMAQGDTPAMRLEQTNLSGYTAQTWDVAGNEANFFVRDLTGGSRLPFRIRPGAPTSSLDIAASGNIGFGTASPANSLHLYRNDGSAKLKIEEASTSTVGRSLLELYNNGPAKVKIVNTNTAADAGTGGWQFNVQSGLVFQIQPATPTAGVVEFKLERNGKLTLAGPVHATAFNTTSDRSLKHQITSVEPRKVLNKVVNMPIEEWTFKGDESAARHIGPMAQDFKEQFGLGSSDTTINLMDSTGVALAAIQGLHQEVAERDTKIQELQKKSEAMEAQMKALMEEVQALKKSKSL